MTGSARPIVVISERLGQITGEERRIEPHATLRRRPLWTEADIANNADADVFLIGAVEPFTDAAIRSLSACRGIVRRGVGLDNVDVAAAAARGIVVANVPDASVEEVSDHALALLLALLRQIVPLDRAVHTGEWMDPKRIEARRRPIVRLRDATLGVIGLGRIGRALATKARPLFARLVGHDPFVDLDAAGDLGVDLVPLDELLATSDAISIHVPLTPETHHLLDRSRLALAKPGLFIVNTARGPIIDSSALIEAIQSGVVAGAALDVVEGEPLDASHALASLDSVVLTGHSAATSKRSSLELRRRAVNEVLALLAGRWPASPVNRPLLADDVAARLQEPR